MVQISYKYKKTENMSHDKKSGTEVQKKQNKAR